MNSACNINILVVGGYSSGKSTLLAKILSDATGSPSPLFQNSFYEFIKKSEESYTMKLNISPKRAATFSCPRTDEIEKLGNLFSTADALLLVIPNSNTEIPTRIIAQCIIARLYGVRQIIVHLSKMTGEPNKSLIAYLYQTLTAFGFDGVYIPGASENEFATKEANYISYYSITELLKSINVDKSQKVYLFDLIDEIYLKKLSKYLVSSLKRQNLVTDFEEILKRSQGEVI